MFCKIALVNHLELNLSKAKLNDRVFVFFGGT